MAGLGATSDEGQTSESASQKVREPPMSRTKIVATIGPRTNNAQSIAELVDAGMDVARLNGAHGDRAWHSRAIDLLRTVAPDVPIILDLPGRKVRIGRLDRTRSCQVGDLVRFTTSKDAAGPTTVPVTADLYDDVSVGDVLRVDDGAMAFTVVDVVGHDVVCRADCPGTISSGKGVGVLSRAKAATLTTQDLTGIELATRKGVDFVGVSFVSSPEHVERVRAVCGADGPRIIAKIEDEDGLRNLESIVDVADGLLLDRGDLAVHTSLESLVTAQKHVLEVARAAAKPVIVATELLHSMIERPAPTKAEVCDIGHAVLDGASAVMLSGETAIGKYPVEAVSLMRRVVDAAAAHEQAVLEQQLSDARGSIPPAMAEAVSLLCRRLPVTKIVAITIGGFAARMAAMGRPRQPILAVTNDAAAARSFNLLPGTEGIYVDIQFSRTSTDHIAACLETLWRRGEVSEEDLILVTSLSYPKSGNRMNLIQTHRIADLRDALQWRGRPVGGKVNRTASNSGAGGLPLSAMAGERGDFAGHQPTGASNYGRFREMAGGDSL